jgi:hypothetical protein
MLNMGWQMGISVSVSGTLWKAGCGKQACPHVLLELDGKHWCGTQTYLHFLLELSSKLQGVMKQVHAFVSISL